MGIKSQISWINEFIYLQVANVVHIIYYIKIMVYSILFAMIQFIIENERKLMYQALCMSMYITVNNREAFLSHSTVNILDLIHLKHLPEWKAQDIPYGMRRFHKEHQLPV